MKQILAILCGWALQSNAQTLYPGGISDCIGRWNFTSAGSSIISVSDVSNNGNTGIAYNLVAANGFRNLPNKAMQFSGFNSYVQVADVPMLSPQAITAVVMVNLDTFYSDICQGTTLISKAYTSFDPGIYSIEVTDHLWDHNCYTYDPAHMQMSCGINGVSAFPQPGNYVHLRNWYLFIMSYDGDSVCYYQIQMDTSNYVNNVTPIFTQGNINSPLGSNTSDLMLGRLNHSQYPYWLNGRMDEAALFRRVLSRSEIQDIYDYLWGKVVIDKPFTDTLVCAGGTIHVAYSVSDNFSANNVFVVQLSDASGSFSNPVTIGSVASNVSGSITCTIPANIPAGNGYRVRIVPSDVMLTSRDNGKDIIITPSIAPSVLISASPNNIVTGQPITFTAFVSAGVSNVNYQWKKNGNLIPGATSNPYVTTNINTGDIISVSIHGSGACVFPDSATSNAITLVPTGIHDLDHVTQINVYPNPSNGDFLLVAKIGKDVTIRMQLFNSLGQVLSEDKIVCRKGTLEKKITMNELPDGFYFMRLSEGENARTVPLIIKH